ncbi:MAG: hypothetical protein NTV37_04200 [Proteobacteria bacterium]|nr:hypothetical protein [Pseudomonadota bacterium]
MKSIHSFFCLFFSLGVAPAQAYELATHARITEQAFLQSNLTRNPEVLLNLGLPANSHVDTVSNVKHFSNNRVDTAVEF